MNKVNQDNLTLGVDLGGTKVATALVDANGDVVASEKFSTNSDKGSEDVIDNIVKHVKSGLGEASQKAHSLGIGVAGQVYKSTGEVRFAPNLKWHRVPLRAKLEQALGIPVVVDNDVRAAAWGEWKYGAGKGIDDIICIFIGTGIGGGIVSGGNLLEGCLNSAGELGHVPIVVGGRKCHCRNQGCLEAYASGWAIKERVQEAVRNDPQAGKTLVDMAGGVEVISGVTLQQAFHRGDLLAGRLVEETADYLAMGIIGFVNILNPCRIVLGGGVIDGLPEYVKLIEQRVGVRALEAAVEKLSFVPASLGDKAVVIGAAGLAYHWSQQG